MPRVGHFCEQTVFDDFVRTSLHVLLLSRLIRSFNFILRVTTSEALSKKFILFPPKNVDFFLNFTHNFAPNRTYFFNGITTSFFSYIYCVIFESCHHSFFLLYIAIGGRFGLPRRRSQFKKTWDNCFIRFINDYRVSCADVN